MTVPRSLSSTITDPDPARPHTLASSGPALIFSILTLFITLGSLVGAALYSGAPLNHDAAILLDFARLILHGWIPYVDFADINPPITHYVHVIPVYLANMSGLEIPTAFNVFVLGLAVYSAAALFLLLSKLTPVFSLPSRLVLTAVCLVFSLWVLRTGEFGQREHLFALAYIPWLYCRAIRHGGGHVPTWAGIVIGLVGAPLFFLKPHFCVLIALAEAWLLLLSRRFSTLWCPEILSLAGCVVAYAVHFCFIPTEMRDEFFFRWLPFAMANYDVYDHSMSEIATQFSLKFWLLQVPVILTALILMTKKRLPDNWKFQVNGLVASLLLAYGIFVAQHKGWAYHLLPAVCFEMMLAATLVVMFLERVLVGRASSPSFGIDRLDACPTKKSSAGVPAGSGPRIGVRGDSAVRTGMFLVVCCCLSLLSIAMAYALFESGKIPDSINDFVRVIRQQVAPDEKVAFISTSVSPAYPTLIYAKRLPGTRFLHAFPIAYLYKGWPRGKDGNPPYRSPSEATPEERRFLDELGSDILKNRPKLVFIEATAKCQACPKGFRVEEYLAAAGWLQRFMNDYRLTRSLHGFAVYDRVD